MESSIDERLGQRLSVHPVDSARYRRTGGVALASGIAGALVIATLILVPSFVSGRVLGLVLFPVLLGFPVAFVQLRKARRSGRDEVVELYDNGIVRRSAAGRQAWTWSEVAGFDVDVSAADQHGVTPIDRFLRSLGWHVRCRIQFTDGARLRLDGHTADLPAIGRALPAHTPAPLAEPDPDEGNWKLPATASVVAAAFAAVLWLLFRYLVGKPADDVSQSMTVVFILVIIVCLVGFVLSATMACMMVVSMLRERR